MKKILLLGGSAQQVIAIETAKRMGYYTVLCDFLPDNPGQYKADKFYLVSTTDKDAVLDVAQAEGIDGILAYASDPAAPTAAYVAEKMELPGNPYKSVVTLCNKDLFRQFLLENGLHAPHSIGTDNREDLEKIKDSLHLPVIVKPVDSSGSKGITVLYNWNQLQQAAEFAFSFSRTQRIIVEEYIEKKHPFLIGGDIFIIDGEIKLWGLMNCHRDLNVNPLVPVGKSYPLVLETNDELAVHQTLQTIVDKLHIKNGAMNVELIIDKENQVWPIDIGPRNGGNMIPDLLGLIFDLDVVEMTIRIAMGECICSKIPKGKPFFATHNLHSTQNGLFKELRIAPVLEEKIIRKCIYKSPGDVVEYFDNAAKAIGIIFFRFDSCQEMQHHLNQISNEIEIILK